MTDNGERALEEAKALFQSLRGSTIISQALCIAIEQLEKVEPPVMREMSNIADMKLLRDELFPVYMSILEALED